MFFAYLPSASTSRLRQLVLALMFPAAVAASVVAVAGAAVAVVTLSACVCILMAHVQAVPRSKIPVTVGDVNSLPPYVKQDFTLVRRVGSTD